MISLPAGSRIWLVAGITDMRNGEGSFLDPRQPFSDLRRREEGLLPESQKNRHIVAVNRLLPEGQNLRQS